MGASRRGAVQSMRNEGINSAFFLIGDFTMAGTSGVALQFRSGCDLHAHNAPQEKGGADGHERRECSLRAKARTYFPRKHLTKARHGQASLSCKRCLVVQQKPDMFHRMPDEKTIGLLDTEQCGSLTRRLWQDACGQTRSLELFVCKGRN